MSAYCPNIKHLRLYNHILVLTLFKTCALDLLLTTTTKTKISHLNRGVKYSRETTYGDLAVVENRLGTQLSVSLPSIRTQTKFEASLFYTVQSYAEGPFLWGKRDATSHRPLPQLVQCTLQMEMLVVFDCWFYLYCFNDDSNTEHFSMFLSAICVSSLTGAYLSQSSVSSLGHVFTAELQMFFTYYRGQPFINQIIYKYFLFL